MFRFNKIISSCVIIQCIAADNFQSIDYKISISIKLREIKNKNLEM